MPVGVRYAIPNRPFIRFQFEEEYMPDGYASLANALMKDIGPIAERSVPRRIDSHLPKDISNVIQAIFDTLGKEDAKPILGGNAKRVFGI